MITRVRREKKCESDREVDYDITISKKKKRKSNVMMRTRRNQKKTHRDTKKKKGEEEKWKRRKKNYVYKKQQKKGTGPKSVSDMVYRTPRERENGGIRIRKKTRIYWAAPGLGLSV